MMIQSAAVISGAALFLVLRWHGVVVLLISSGLSAALAWRWHDGYWWGCIHALFLPAILLALRLELAPGWYLFAFGISWLIFGSGAANRVPLFLSNRKVLEVLEEQLPAGARLLDIGAGSGTVLAWLAKRRPDLQLTGIEYAWLPWLIGRLRLPRQVNWLRGDYREISFADFDAGYAFLSPVPMAELWQKAHAEMPAGALFLSNTFEVPDVTPDEVIELGDWKGGKLLLWRM